MSTEKQWPPKGKAAYKPKELKLPGKDFSIQDATPSPEKKIRVILGGYIDRWSPIPRIKGMIVDLFSHTNEKLLPSRKEPISQEARTDLID